MITDYNTQNWSLNVDYFLEGFLMILVTKL